MYIFDIIYDFFSSEGKRYDISRRRTPNTPGAAIMLDYLEFKHDEVFNLVVDRVSPENILITTEERYLVKMLKSET